MQIMKSVESQAYQYEASAVAISSGKTTDEGTSKQ
jgi:hypothetical protein